MPTFAADVLPDTTGRNLGNPSQRWNLFAQNLDIQSISGMPVVFSGVMYCATVPTTASGNTTAWQDLDNCKVSAGLLNAVGKAIRGTLGGTWTTQSGQSPNMDIAVNLSNLQIFGVSLSGLQSGNPNMTWRAQFEAVVITAGTAGQMVRHGQILSQFTTAGGGEAMPPVIDINSLPQGPIDFTQDQMLQAVAKFTTNTSPANSVTLDVFIVEILN